MPQGQKDRDYNKALGARVRLARVHAKLSQTALGEKIGVTFQQVQKYENGSNRISAELLVKLAELLGVAPLDLLQGDAAVTLQSAPVIDDALRLAEVLERIRPDVRRRVVALVKTIAEPVDTSVFEVSLTQAVA